MKPTTAQLRILIHMVERGGEDYAVVFATAATVRACLDRGWLERLPGQKYQVVKDRITEAGREAARQADPDMYASAEREGRKYVPGAPVTETNAEKVTRANLHGLTKIEAGRYTDDAGNEYVKHAERDWWVYRRRVESWTGQRLALSGRATLAAARADMIELIEAEQAGSAPAVEPSTTERAEVAGHLATDDEAAPIVGEVLERTVRIGPPRLPLVRAAMSAKTAGVTVLVASRPPAVGQHAEAQAALHAEAFGLVDLAAHGMGDVSPLRARGLAEALTRPDIMPRVPIRCQRLAEPAHACHEGQCPRTPAGVDARGLGGYLEAPALAGTGDLVAGVTVERRRAVLGVVTAAVPAPRGFVGWRYDVQTTMLLPTGEAATVRVYGAGVTVVARADESVPCPDNPGGWHDTPTQFLACAIAHARAEAERTAGGAR